MLNNSTFGCIFLFSANAFCSFGALFTFVSAIFSPSSINIAIGLLTLIPSEPSETSIFSMVPSSTASNSIVALSVSISARISPAETVSPSLTNHFANVPSSIVGDSAGIKISVVICDPLMRKYQYKVLQVLVQG